MNPAEQPGSTIGAFVGKTIVYFVKKVLSALGSYIVDLFRGVPAALGGFLKEALGGCIMEVLGALGGCIMEGLGGCIMEVLEGLGRCIKEVLEGLGGSIIDVLHLLSSELPTSSLLISASHPNHIDFLKKLRREIFSYHTVGFVVLVVALGMAFFAIFRAINYFLPPV